jgi:hypothetical protein
LEKEYDCFDVFHHDLLGQAEEGGVLLQDVPDLQLAVEVGGQLLELVAAAVGAVLQGVALPEFREPQEEAVLDGKGDFASIEVVGII